MSGKDKHLDDLRVIVNSFEVVHDLRTLQVNPLHFLFNDYEHDCDRDLIRQVEESNKN